MKTYIFDTVDNTGYIRTYEVECFSFERAKDYKKELIGNSMKGEKTYGQTRRVK